MQITFCLKLFIKSKLYKDYIQLLLQNFCIQIKLGDNEIHKIIIKLKTKACPSSQCS